MKEKISNPKDLMKPTEHPLFDRLSEIIHSHQKFIITTHLLPDGDGLGGEVSLASYLKSLGKECQIMNADPTPEKFSLVDPDQEIEVWSERQKLLDAEIIFGIDVNDEKRIGKLLGFLKKLKVRLIFVDHHILEEPLKNKHIVDPEVSSMGEFFYRYFQYVKADINFKMALAMYVSLITDTQHFRHRKTTSLSHAIAAALVEIGVAPQFVHQMIHQTKSLGEMKLLGEVLREVRSEAGGKIVWMEVSQEHQRHYGVSAEETQGFADHLMRLKDAEVGMLFREQEDSNIKVSFRSKGNVEIFPIVKKLGGGGHAYEAGTLLSGPMEKAVLQVLKEIKKLFS